MNDNTNQTRFWHQLRSFGIKHFIVSVDFLVAFIILIAMILSKSLHLDIFSIPDGGYIIAIFAAASTLFAITLAALAIILSFSSSEFVTFLRQHNKFSKLLFLFWSGNAAYLLVIFLSMTYLFLNSNTLGCFKEVVLYPSITALFVYALIDTFYILGAVIRFGHFLDLYEKYKNRNDK
jgi:hypothetical protein